MKAVSIILSLILLLLSVGCQENKPTPPATTPQEKQTPVTEVESETNYLPSSITQLDSLYHIDLNQPLDTLTLAEIRLLRNGLYARRGYLFQKAELRGYFDQTGWYEQMVFDVWDYDQQPNMDFTDAENAFIQRCKAQEKVLLAQNFVKKDGQDICNPNNLVNAHQFENLSPELLSMITHQGVAIVPDQHIQLFHVYEENDYHQIPNFVTTDMFLQLYHIYFSYFLRDLEENIFHERISQLSAALLNQAIIDYSNIGRKVYSPQEYAVIFFSVANALLGGQPDTDLPAHVKATIDIELSNIKDQKDMLSVYLGYTEFFFPYSLFKPRGHYTRSDKLKQYFVAMMWLQKGELCLNNEAELTIAVYLSQLLNDVSIGDESALSAFKSIYDPIKFIIGEPDNLSILDVAQVAETTEDINTIRKALLKIPSNRIASKIATKCDHPINFMPQRYLFDNEILNELVDEKTKPTKRAYPKGIDVFGIMGNDMANDLIENFYEERIKWPKYGKRYNKLKQQVDRIDSWEHTVYNKWMSCLRAMNKQPKGAPAFMKMAGWKKKELNTMLASWAELKHDALLYAEQPMGAECGGGGPPPPITVGYVEPNLAFWEEMLELIELTKTIISENNLSTGKNTGSLHQIEELCKFLHRISQKELSGEKLTNEEYETIEIIGSTVEYITLGLMDNHPQFWSEVKGPDREVAIVADIYTNGYLNNPNMGILHSGVGAVNNLYVIVEIEGMLYLTKGATFSYYEFVEPMNSRMTDEQWQERLKNNPHHRGIPKWMNDIILPNKAPSTNEKIFYSSGC